MTEMLTVQDVARRLSVPVSWVYAAAESGRLPSYRIGRYRRFAAHEIDEWIAAQHADNGGGYRGD